MGKLKEKNNPLRKYKRDYKKISDKPIKIQSTLLEYDQKNNLLNNILVQQNQSQKQTQELQIKQQQIEEEINLKNLISEMSETDCKSKLTANNVGQILGNYFYFILNNIKALREMQSMRISIFN